MNTRILQIWRNELETACRELSDWGAAACIRGEGAAIFLSAEHGGRSVEVYGSDWGGYVVEVWESSCDDSARCANVPGIAEAITESKSWLLTQFPREPRNPPESNHH